MFQRLFDFLGREASPTRRALEAGRGHNDGRVSGEVSGFDRARVHAMRLPSSGTELRACANPQPDLSRGQTCLEGVDGVPLLVRRQFLKR